MSNESVEFVTIYRGKDSVTYLAKEFEELGENATPYSVRQNPSDKAFFAKIHLRDADAIRTHTEPSLKELKKLMKENKGEWKL